MPERLDEAIRAHKRTRREASAEWFMPILSGGAIFSAYATVAIERSAYAPGTFEWWLAIGQAGLLAPLWAWMVWLHGRTSFMRGINKTFDWFMDGGPDRRIEEQEEASE